MGSRKESSEKQKRAQAYNRANGILVGTISQLRFLNSELPFLDDKINIMIGIAINDLKELRQVVIDHQEKLIKEGK